MRVVKLRVLSCSCELPLQVTICSLHVACANFNMAAADWESWEDFSDYNQWLIGCGNPIIFNDHLQNNNRFQTLRTESKTILLLNVSMFYLFSPNCMWQMCSCCFFLSTHSTWYNLKSHPDSTSTIICFCALEFVATVIGYHTWTSNVCKI